MAKKKNLLDRLDEVRTNSVTPEEFEKAWGMSVEEYREQIRAFSKEQDAALAEKKRKESSTRIMVITQAGTGKGRVTYGPGVIRAAKSAILQRNMAHNIGKHTIAELVKMINAKQKEDLGLTDMQKMLLNKLGPIGGAGGKASGRKGGKGRKG